MQFTYSVILEEKPIIDRIIRLVKGKFINVKDSDNVDYAELSLNLRENTVNLSLRVRTYEQDREKITLADYSNWLTEDFYVVNSENLRKCFKILKLATNSKHVYSGMIRPESLSYKDAEYCFGCSYLGLETKRWDQRKHEMLPCKDVDVFTYDYSIKFGNTDGKPNVSVRFRERGVYAFVNRKNPYENFASQIVGAISWVIHYSILYGRRPHPLIECIK